MQALASRSWFLGCLALSLAASLDRTAASEHDGPAEVGTIGATAAQDSADAAPQEADAERLEKLKHTGRQLQRSFGAMEVARQALERHEFDVTACAERIGEEADATFAWVRDETRWIPYRGALRGARGVLLDRMGSHLDRSLLLARLLEEAGHEVRLARVTLTEAQAAELNDIVKATLPVVPVEARRPDQIQADVLRAAQLLNTDVSKLSQRVFEAQTASERMSEQLFQHGAEQSTALAQALEWPTGDVEKEPAFDQAASLALRDHWWVQVRAGDKWNDLDPSRRSHAPGDRLTEGEPAATYAPDELPADQYHGLKVEVVAERVSPKGRTDNVVLTHEIRCPDAACETITLAWGAIGAQPLEAFDEDGAFSKDVLRDSALAILEWMPALRVGGALVSKASVRADGSVNPTPGRGLAGKGFGQALDALNGGQDPNAHLTAVHLQYTVSAPGREEQVFRRPVVDLLGPAARANDAAFEISDAGRLQRSLALSGSTQVMLQGCWLPPELVVDRWLEAALKNRQAQLGMAYAASRGDSAGARAGLGSITPPDTQLVLLAAQRRDRSPHAATIALTQLNLLGYVRTPLWDDAEPKVAVTYDIVQNAVAVLPEATPPARSVRLAQGVLETLLEAELVSSGGDVVNTARRFAKTLASGDDVLVLRGTEDMEPLHDRLDSEGRARIAGALELGQVVVLAGTPSATTEAQWWRIDPASGTCLGIGPGGRGQGEAVKAVALISIGLTTIGALQCVDSTDSERMGCCVAAWFVGVAGETGLALYLGGGVLGAAVALGAAIGYGLLMSDFCD